MPNSNIMNSKIKVFIVPIILFGLNILVLWQNCNLWQNKKQFDDLYNIALETRDYITKSKKIADLTVISGLNNKSELPKELSDISVPPKSLSEIIINNQRFKFGGNRVSAVVKARDKKNGKEIRWYYWNGEEVVLSGRDV
jgi:hypothetical protein